MERGAKDGQKGCKKVATRVQTVRGKKGEGKRVAKWRQKGDKMEAKGGQKGDKRVTEGVQKGGTRVVKG